MGSSFSTTPFEEVYHIPSFGMEVLYEDTPNGKKYAYFDFKPYQYRINSKDTYGYRVKVSSNDYKLIQSAIQIQLYSRGDFNNNWTCYDFEIKKFDPILNDNRLPPTYWEIIHNVGGWYHYTSSINKLISFGDYSTHDGEINFSVLFRNLPLGESSEIKFEIIDGKYIDGYFGYLVENKILSDNVYQSNAKDSDRSKYTKGVFTTRKKPNQMRTRWDRHHKTKRAT
jgi:hypothetical protein